MRVVLASSNPGKLREFRELLAPLGFEVAPQAEVGVEPAIESGASFIDNALIKARHAARIARTSAMADDSGLEVDALGGAPGVLSARYAGEGATDERNNAKLLQELARHADTARRARYRCVIAYVRGPDDPQPVLAQGAWEGRIAMAARGQGGFGYDPLFVPDGEHRTAAELPAAEKHSMSHRGTALRALLSQLAAQERS